MKIRPSIKHSVVSAAAIALFTSSQIAWSEEEPVETEVAVEVAKVEKTTLRAYLTVYGYVEGEPAKEGGPPASTQIAPLVAGIVSEVKCYEGLHVDKGAVLCLLDSRLAEIEVERTRQSLELAEKAFRRQEELQTSDATSEKTYQEIENQLTTARSDFAAAQIQLSNHRVLAPFAGTITRLNVRPGEHVELTTIVAEITDFTRLVAALSVPVAEVSVLRPGQSVEINAENGGPSLTGELKFVSPRVDSASGTITAYSSLPADTPLRPGRFVRARITSDEHRDCLAVPVTSVVKDAEEGWIIAVVKNGRAIRMKVKTGLRDRGLVEVESEELKEGMTVITLGTYALPDNTKVRVIGRVTGEK
jgi:RND family efflux transporter MFP subunit